MSKIEITVKVESYQEAVDFLNGRIPVVVPIEEPTEEPVEEPEEPVEPPEEPIEEPPVEEPVIEEPVVSVEINVINLPPMATVGFDITKDLTNSLPLFVNKDDVIAVKLQKIEGWTWKMTNTKNMQILMKYGDFYILKCQQSNTETHTTFVMFNNVNPVGASLYVEFAVAN